MNKLNSFLALMGLIFMLAGCSATNHLTISAVEPAAIYLAPEIQNVAIINRTVASEKYAGIDAIDKILSAEGMRLDEKGAEATVESLRHELNADRRFEKVIEIDSLNLPNKGMGVFPARLDWDYVTELCKTNGIDVLFSLEFYDTDTHATYQLTNRELPNSLGINVKIPYHKVTLNTQIKNGWRIYDPYEKIVLDEFSSAAFVSSVGEGVNPLKAVEAAIAREEGVIDRSQYIGNQYAWRIRPVKKRIARDYFVRGSDNFKVAKRKAQTGDWDGASLLWERELGNPKRKVAGRATYNMAIINEINGNLEKAIEWATRSYTEYRTKEALRYMHLLNYRVAEQAELERQTSR